MFVAGVWQWCTVHGEELACSADALSSTSLFARRGEKMVECDGFVAATALCIISLPKQSASEWTNVFFAYKTAVIHMGIIFKEIFAFVRAETQK